MAKWGEGDERWLVQQRDDGRNVNGWHWEEKNKMEWTRFRLGELLVGTTAEVEGVAVGSILRVTEVKEITGEACITIRKGNKRFAVFDLKVTIAWEGDVVGEEKKVSGEAKLEELISTGDPDDYIYSVTAEGTGAPQSACKRAAENELRAKVYSLVAQFVEEINAMA